MIDNFVELFQRADKAEVMLPDGRLVTVEMDCDGGLLVTIGKLWGPTSAPITVAVDDDRAAVVLPDGATITTTPSTTTITTPSTTTITNQPTMRGE